MKKKQKKEAKKKDKEEKKKKRKRSKMVSKNNNNNGGEDFTEERRKRRKGSETHRSEANVFGYSNHKNPFNDPNLNKPFVGIGGNLGFCDRNIDVQPSEPVCNLYPA